MHVEVLLPRLLFLGRPPEELGFRIGRVAREVQGAFRGGQGGDDVHAFWARDAGGAFGVFERDALQRGLALVVIGKRGGDVRLGTELAAEVFLARSAVLRNVRLQPIEEPVVERLVRTAILDDQGAGGLLRPSKRSDEVRQRGE